MSLCDHFLWWLWFMNVQYRPRGRVHVPPLCMCVWVGVFITSLYRKSAEEDGSKYFHCGNGS